VIGCKLPRLQRAQIMIAGSKLIMMMMENRPPKPNQMPPCKCLILTQKVSNVWVSSKQDETILCISSFNIGLYEFMFSLLQICQKFQTLTSSRSRNRKCNMIANCPEGRNIQQTRTKLKEVLKTGLSEKILLNLLTVLTMSINPNCE